jgi:hypothetical protein
MRGGAKLIEDDVKGFNGGIKEMKEMYEKDMGKQEGVMGKDETNLRTLQEIIDKGYMKYGQYLHLFASSDLDNPNDPIH